MKEVATVHEGEERGSASIANSAADNDAETTESGDTETEETRSKAKIADRRPSKQPALSPVMRSIRDDEEKSLRDWLEAMGPTGAFKVQLKRVKPAEVRDPKTGRMVKVEGYLDTYAHAIDEAFIAQTWGGGTFSLKITRQSEDGSYKYEKGLHRTLEIAGEPLIDRLPTNTVAATSAPAPAETVSKELLGMVRDLTGKSEVRGIDPAMQMMLTQLREDAQRQHQAHQRDIERRDLEMAEMRRQLAARDAMPQDTFKDQLLGKFVEGESSRLESLRLRHDAEVRTIKEAAAAELQRVRDIATQDAKLQWDRFERQMADLKQSHEREIATLRSTNEVMVTATKSSADTQKTILEAEVRRLERELDSMREEIKDLRAKKDKTLLEQVKEIQTFKEALDIDGDGDKSGFDKAVELVNNPAAAEFVKGIFGKNEPAAAPAATAAPVQAQAVPKGPRLMSAPDGQKFWAMADGSLQPAKKKPKVIPPQIQPDGTVTPEITLPQIDEDRIKAVVAYLERAHAASQEPEVVAQSGRTFVPDEILAWIRDNHTEQLSGVDLFMTKVAKLPMSSPLSTQSGKNWLRKVGKALIGS